MRFSACCRSLCNAEREAIQQNGAGFLHRFVRKHLNEICLRLLSENELEDLDWKIGRLEVGVLLLTM